MKYSAVISVAAVLMLLSSSAASGHCDTMNGPVVLAARKALETGNVNFALVWVRAQDEVLIRSAFAKTMEVRKLTPQAMELSDMYFFETLVRIHRASEGMPFAGIKPAETELDEGIAEAEKALESGTVGELVKKLTASVNERMQVKFGRAFSKKKFDPDNLQEGREYVRAYVAFIHYAEQLFQSAAMSAEGHSAEHESAGEQEHDH